MVAQIEAQDVVALVHQALPQAQVGLGVAAALPAVEDQDETAARPGATVAVVVAQEPHGLRRVDARVVVPGVEQHGLLVAGEIDITWRDHRQRGLRHA